MPSVCPLSAAIARWRAAAAKEAVARYHQNRIAAHRATKTRAARL